MILELRQMEVIRKLIEAVDDYEVATDLYGDCILQLSNEEENILKGIECVIEKELTNREIQSWRNVFDEDGIEWEIIKISKGNAVLMDGEENLKFINEKNLRRYEDGEWKYKTQCQKEESDRLKKIEQEKLNNDDEEEQSDE